MENSKQPGAAMKHENGLSTLAVNRDGKKKIIGGGVDGPVKLWDVASHKHVVTWSILRLYPDVEFSPDDACMLFGNGIMELQEMNGGNSARTFQLGASCLLTARFSPNGKKNRLHNGG